MIIISVSLEEGLEALIDQSNEEMLKETTENPEEKDGDGQNVVNDKDTKDESAEVEDENSELEQGKVRHHYSEFFFSQKQT